MNEGMNSRCAGLVEHAAWTKGDGYLDTPLKNMPWYQQILVDVFAVSSALAAIVAVVSLWTCKWCSRCCGKAVKVV